MYTIGADYAQFWGGRGAGQTHLNLDAKIAHEGRPQGAPLPDSGSLTRFCPNSMQLPWVGAIRAG